MDKSQMKPDPEPQVETGCEIVVNKFGPRPGFKRPSDEEIIAATKAPPVQSEQDPKDA